MRSAGSALLARVAMLVGSLTLLAFVTTTLVLDPERPARVLGAMVGTDAGRDLAAKAIASELDRLDPRLTRAQADRLARRVVDDPRLESALTGAADGRSDGVLTAVLDSVRRVNPAAAAQLEKRLPAGDGRAAASDRLVPSALGGEFSRVRDRLAAGIRTGLLVALATAVAALLLSPDRLRTARRLGRWCLVASAVQVFIWVGLPRILDRVDGDWPVVAAAALRAAGSTLAGVFTALFAAGAGLVAAGYAGRFLRLPARSTPAPGSPGVPADPHPTEPYPARPYPTSAWADPQLPGRPPTLPPPGSTRSWDA